MVSFPGCFGLVLACSSLHVETGSVFILPRP
jgi:hypothetical protein